VTAESENLFANRSTIYVEGLPFTATEANVREFFSPSGQIKSIRLSKWHDSGRLRGYGHIEFETPEAAEASLLLDGCDFFDSGRYVRISQPLIPRSAEQIEFRSAVTRPPGCRTIFFKNVPYSVTEEEVREAFMICGPINTVRLAVWGHTGQSKGFGYVDFKREDSAEIAVKKSGIISIQGRPLVIDFETGVPKASFKSGNDAKKQKKEKR